MMKMNGTTIEADLLLNHTDMSVLERQRAHLGDHSPDFDSTVSGLFSHFDGFLGPAGLDIPLNSAETTMENKDARHITSCGYSKKRKFDSSVTTETRESNEKKRMMKREEDEKSKTTELNNGSTKTIKKMKNKEQKNCSNDSSKTDYIHVRARRGQATDSHSIAERVRREKISERMKFLQDLVPGCDKVTGKAGMLDEIINYVQSLQRQVEFLSMKLAAVNPRADFDMDDIFAKQVVSAPMTNLPNIVMPSHEMVNSGYLHFNPMHQVVTNSDPLSCFNNGQAPPLWDSDVHNFYSSLGV